MKVIVEIDTDEELEKVERFLRLLDPSIIKVSTAAKAHKIQDFIHFIDKEATTVVEKIIIPSREERHAR